jgi:hypothetical protein
MREQGIAANATPRAIRGENKNNLWDGIFKPQRYGKSTAMHDRVIGIAKELSRSGTVADPARERLLETRNSLVSTWMKAAEVLDAQGEMILAGDVRYFAGHCLLFSRTGKDWWRNSSDSRKSSVRSGGPSAATPRTRSGRGRGLRLQP